MPQTIQRPITPVADAVPTKHEMVYYIEMTDATDGSVTRIDVADPDTLIKTFDAMAAMPSSEFFHLRARRERQGFKWHVRDQEAKFIRNEDGEIEEYVPEVEERWTAEDWKAYEADMRRKEGY